MTQIISASQAREQWAQLLNTVYRDQKRIVVEKSGIPVAVVISTEDLKRLTHIEEQRIKRFQILDEVAASLQDVSTEQLLKEVHSSHA